MAALKIALGLLCFFPDSSSSSAVKQLQMTASQIFWEIQGVPLFWFLFSNSLVRTTSPFTSFLVDFMMILHHPQIYPHPHFPFSVSNTNLMSFVTVSTCSCYSIGFFLFVRLVFSNSLSQFPEILCLGFWHSSLHFIGSISHSHFFLFTYLPYLCSWY